jgi:translation initiation factor IF-3
LKPIIQKNDLNQPVNEQIRYPRVQVITHEGNNVGIVTREEALKLARAAGLDLVLVSDTGKENVPVTKIMDFGKLLYAKKKKMAEAKKHQKTVQIKEIKMRTKIGEHDFLTKMKQAVQFLKEGKHVKVTLVFRGREAALSQESGVQMFQKIDQVFEQEGLSVMRDKETKSNGFWSIIYIAKVGKK